MEIPKFMKEMSEEDALKFAFFLFMELSDHEVYAKEALDEESRELSFQIIDACSIVTQVLISKGLISSEQILNYAREQYGFKGDMTCQ